MVKGAAVHGKDDRTVEMGMEVSDSSVKVDLEIVAGWGADSGQKRCLGDNN